MRKLLAFLAIVGALTVVNVASAQQAPAPAHEKKAKAVLTDEQKKLRHDLLAKYDANKDGKLDKDELAKVSEEDKAKLKEAHLGGGGPPGKKKDK